VVAEATRSKLATGLVYPESPRYRDGLLWLVDLHAHNVVTVAADGSRETVLQLDDRPSALGFLPDGTLLVASARKRLILRLDGESPSVYADLNGIAGEYFNDMVVDGRGNIYIANRFIPGPDKPDVSPEGIVHVSPSGAIREVAPDVGSPNGMAVTADGGTLIVAMSHDHKLLAFDIEDDGSLANRRLFAELQPRPELDGGHRASPDGICLDAEAAVWVGSPESREFLRISADGKIVDRIALPAPHRAVACVLGGPERRTLYMVISETTKATLAACKRDPEAELRSTSKGWIDTIEVTVPGVGWP
jgi:sugar lactone lactonase YvrE